MPSSSATCSTTTVSTIASSSARVSQRCSIGRRNSTSRVGVVAAAAHQGGERHRLGASQSSGSAGCPPRRTPPARAGPASARRPRSRSRAPGRRTARARVAQLRACPGSARQRRPGPRMPRPRRSRRRRRRGGPVGAPGAERRVVHAASLIGRAAAPGYRRRRESRPPLFAHRVRPSRGHHADLRVRRPDRRRSARSRPTPSRTPTTSATPTASGSRAPRGWEVLRLAPDPAAQGPSSDDLLALADAGPRGRPPGPPAPRPAPATRRRGREIGRRGHLRMLTSD